MSEKLIDQVPENLRYLLEDETRAYAFLATLMKDGSPQLTPIWFIIEDDQITFNSAKGRVKDINLRRDARLSLVIIDFDNPLQYLQIRGRVIEITEEGAVEHINALGQKYQGRDWEIAEGQVRLVYRVQADSIS